MKRKRSVEAGGDRPKNPRLPQEALNDPRFQRIATDKRFKPIREKETKIRLDDRFKGMLKDEKFASIVDIDRYGRPLPDQRSNLEKYYAVEGEESEKSREKKRPKLAAKQTKSQEEKNKKKKKDESSEESSEGESFEGSDGSGDPSSSLSGSSGSSGLSGSGSDSGDEPNVPGSGSESGESGEGEGEGDEDSSFTSMSSDSSWSGEENEEKEQVPTGEATNRIAVVGLDWNLFRSDDLWNLFAGFLPAGGSLLDVTIYQSDFGKTFLEEEEKLGPSPLRGLKRKEPSQRDARAYEKEKRKCHFGIVSCSDVPTAMILYRDLDGFQIENGADLDLRYVPDEQSFEGRKVLNTCKETPENYKPPLEVMQKDSLALTNTPVQWDELDPRRKILTKSKFTSEEIDEHDWATYLASSESEEEDDNDEATREKYRQLLLGNDYTPAPSTKSTTTTTTKKDDSKKTEKEKAVGSTGLTFDVYGPSDEESDESDESGESGESGESDSDKEDKKGGRKGRSDEVEGEMEATFVPGLAEKTQKLIKDRQKQKSKDQETQFQKDRKKIREKKKQQKKGEKQLDIEGWGEGEDGEGIVDGDADAFADWDDNDFVKPKKLSKREEKRRREKNKTEEEKKADMELELIAMDPTKEIKKVQSKQQDKDEKPEKKRQKKKRKEKEVAAQNEKTAEVIAKDSRFAKLFTDDRFARDPSANNFEPTDKLNKIIIERKVKERKKKVKSSESPKKDDSEELAGMVTKLKQKFAKK